MRRERWDLSPVVFGALIVGPGSCGIVPPVAFMEALLAVLFDFRELLLRPRSAEAHAIGGGAGLLVRTFPPLSLFFGGFSQLG